MYKEIREKIKVGDVIVSSGVGLFAQAIKTVTRSDYTHVSIVINADLGEGLGKRIMVVESTTSGLDVKLEKVVRGVQMSWLSRQIEIGTVIGERFWLLPLKQPLSETQIVKLKSYLDGSHLKKYDYHQLLAAGIDIFDKFGLFVNRPDLVSVFCSELVTAALLHIDVLPPNINPSEQTPHDVTLFPCFSPLIPLS